MRRSQAEETVQNPWNVAKLSTGSRSEIETVHRRGLVGIAE